MNTNTLKEIYEKMPKRMKYCLAPAFIRYMIGNPVYRKTYSELLNYEKLDSQDKKEYQLKRLKETLQYAYSHVPYYKELFDRVGFEPAKMTVLADIEKLPLMEKNDAVQAGDKLYSQEKGLKYYKTFTGGSSGQSLTVLLDKESIYRERACVTHFLSKFGYDPLKTKTVIFYGHNKNDEDFYYSPLKNEIVISPFRLFKDNELDNICDDIEKFGATFLMGYPSAIVLFAQMLEKSGRKLNFEHVVYCSENCSDENKRYIEKIFNCGVDSYYGHTERACFAEIYESGCVFNDYYGYTELIPTENENEYRIVCTGFLSRKMPLIRYATDDVVYKNTDGSMHLVGHRRSEIYLISKNGQKVFKGAMTLHVEELKKIRRYQYVQNEPGKAELQIVQGEPLTEAEIARVNDYIQRRCEGLLDITIRMVDEIQLTARGKFNWAVNNIGK